MIRAMWTMTECAVLRGRRMLPQEWSAFFSMAVIANVVHASAYQHGSVAICCTMRSMTIGTNHLPVLQGMVREALQLRAFTTVARCAKPSLGVAIERRIASGMNDMTGRAYDASTCVIPVMPKSAALIVVATETDAIELIRIVMRSLEIDEGCAFLTPPEPPSMLTARTVTCFTLQGGKWRPRITTLAVRSSKDGHDRYFRICIVATQAGIGTAGRIGRQICIFSLRCSGYLPPPGDGDRRQPYRQNSGAGFHMGSRARHLIPCTRFTSAVRPSP